MVHKAPLDKFLKAGAKIELRLEVPDASEVVLFREKVFLRHLRKTRGVFEAIVTAESGALNVGVKIVAKDSTTNAGILRYFVESGSEKEVFSANGSLKEDDPLDAAGFHFKIHSVALTAGKVHFIHLEAAADQPAPVLVRVEDGKGNVLDKDFLSGGGRDALLAFTPQRTDTYHIVATSVQPGACGGYRLLIRR
jgi:hypothetical protein